MKKKKTSLEARQANHARLFMLPWVIGLIVFFISPIISSIVFSFSTVKIVPGGMESTFAGLTHYKYLIVEDANFIDNVMNSIKGIVTEMPLIVALSLILAVILNGKFAGRIVARAVFFLPVIIATGVVMNLLSGDEIQIPLFTMTSENESEYGGMIDFASILSGLDLPEELNELISKWMGNIFGLLWSVGIQTVLFIAGLQSIPSSMYEVSKVEGANKWQEFWFITIPMLGQVILLVMVFTLIEQLTAVDNPIMSQVYTVLRQQNVYDRSAAMIWIYFIIVAACMGAILFIYKKLCLDRWSNERSVKRAQ